MFCEVVVLGADDFHQQSKRMINIFVSHEDDGVYNHEGGK